jgi:hypothetical protein
VNCFQKCGFNLSEINDGKDAIKLSEAKDIWSLLTAGVSFEEYVSCDNDVGQSQWPQGLRGWFVAAHLLRLRVRIPPGA